MKSPRLIYEPLSPRNANAFHALVVDPYVRRFLLDGALKDAAWSAERALDSQASFAARGVGLWLAHGAEGTVGFCGYLGRGEGPTFALHYALLEPYAGRGLATEMARAALEAAEGLRIVADVDEQNAGSVRILEKLGFVRVSSRPGMFGLLLDYELGR